MKKDIFLALLVSIIRCVASGQEKQLPLLIPNNNFKLEILDRAFTKPFDSTSIVMLRLQQNSPQSDLTLEDQDYEIKVTSLKPEDFALFNLTDDKYIGYFEFKKHLVLVYGNTDGDFFFSKILLKKKISFLLSKSDNGKDVYVSLEPIVFVYKFHSDKFVFKYAARFGFYR